MANIPTEHVTYTTRQYPCGCKAEGPGDVPDYCPDHGLPPGLRDPIKVMERGGMLNDLMNQRDGWEKSAAEFCRGMEYYRGLVDEIGKLLGDAAYICDDGSRSEDILRAKVPELVKARLSALDQTHE